MILRSVSLLRQYKSLEAPKVRENEEQFSGETCSTMSARYNLTVSSMVMNYFHQEEGINTEEERKGK